jgi:FkbM family methyltransferase
MIENHRRVEVTPNGIPANSYSQYGDDLVIDALLGCKKNGVYIDVGANDPVELSNTYRFYKRGWRGIAVEPNPNLCQKFTLKRPGDEVINKGIGTKSGFATFYVISPHSLSSFDKKDADRNCRMFGAKITSEVDVYISPLATITAKYKNADLMSIDVEGRELDVINSNDWSKNRPKVITMEIYYNGDLLKQMMEKLNYKLIYTNKADGIFIDTTNPVFEMEKDITW